MRSTPVIHQHVGFRGAGADSHPAPCLQRTGFKVRVLVELIVGEGLTVDEIAADYELTPAEIHAGLSYYYDHRAEIDAEIRELNDLVSALGH